MAFVSKQWFSTGLALGPTFLMVIKLENVTQFLIYFWEFD